jgi:hypothetical protein
MNGWRGRLDMANGDLRHRIARREDLAAITMLMDAAIAELQKPFLDDAQIRSSRSIIGLDTQLVDDGTYFVVEHDASWRVAEAGAGARRCTVRISRPGVTRRCLTPPRTRRVSEPCIPIRPLSDAVSVV